MFVYPFAVLASFFFSFDHTLMSLEAMLKRAIGYGFLFFNLKTDFDQMVRSPRPVRHLTASLKQPHRNTELE